MGPMINLWQLGAGTPFTVRLKLRPCPEPFEDLVFGPTSYDVHAIEVRVTMLLTLITVFDINIFH